MNKRSLSESDICDRYISPALVLSGWDETRWRREYPFTAGRIIVRGELIARGKQKRADYLLFYKPNIPIAVIEAKDNTHSIGAEFDFDKYEVGGCCITDNDPDFKCMKCETTW